MDTSKATPRPWRAEDKLSAGNTTIPRIMSGALLIAEFESEDILDQPIPGIENRDFALHAVNAHDELVLFLRRVVDDWTRLPFSDLGQAIRLDDLATIARVLLAKLDEEKSK